MRIQSLGWGIVVLTVALAAAQEGSGPALAPAKSIRIGHGLMMELPPQWISKEPRSRIIEHECAVPAVAGDETGGRVTMMGAGGSVAANLERWIGQFVQPDGSESRDQAQLTQQEVAGQQIHTIDIRGTYKDRPRGPRGPTVEQPNYRMLGAVIVTADSGSYFVKLYGPEKTVAANEKAFHAMLGGLRETDPSAE